VGKSYYVILTAILHKYKKYVRIILDILLVYLPRQGIEFAVTKSYGEGLPGARFPFPCHPLMKNFQSNAVALSQSCSMTSIRQPVSSLSRNVPKDR
jgi:hypothetical protein